LSLTEEEALAIFSKTNAIMNGHFRLNSGRHSNVYVKKDTLYLHTHETARLCRSIAEHFADYAIDLVVAPEKGGIILSQYVTYCLTEFLAGASETLAAYAEKNPLTGLFEFHREHDQQIPGRNILIVEDVLTTGGSVAKVIKLVRSLGGIVAGVGALWNRGGVSAGSLGILELHATINKQFPSWLPNECPSCFAGIPIDNVLGHGKVAAPPVAN
jgi:orotate phosphoribosyltransferase